MNDLQLAITRQDLRGLEEIARLVGECEGAGIEGVRSRYRQITEMLAANVARLNLDEHFGHLTAFARCFACEAMSAAARQVHFPFGCWSSTRRDHPPFFSKRDGHNSPASEVLSSDGQKAAMLMVLAAILTHDQQYAAGALALQEFQESEGLLAELENIHGE